MKVIVAGGRDFTDIVTMQKTIKLLVLAGYLNDEVELICGMARGADTTGYILWTQCFKLPVHKFPAEWDKYGKSAGYKRNAEMLKHADAVVAFWDGQSRGTANMIQISRAKGIPTFVVQY